jgi:Holliday junction resolvase RusA-like endonuclease
VTQLRIGFTVAGPPVPKARARLGKGGTYTPARTVAYERLVALTAVAARQSVVGWPLTGATYSITMSMSRSGRFDVDNVAKAILDACNGVLWRDDSAVHEIHAVRVEGDPRLVVEVEARRGP